MILNKIKQWIISKSKIEIKLSYIEDIILFYIYFRILILIIINLNKIKKILLIIFFLFYLN